MRVVPLGPDGAHSGLDDVHVDVDVAHLGVVGVPLGAHGVHPGLGVGDPDVVIVSPYRSPTSIGAPARARFRLPR